MVLKIYLDLAGNRISEIKGLDNLTKIEDLDLGTNQILEIKGLENLVNLKELFLPGNRISEVKGLDNLVNLKEVWLNNNRIERLDDLRFPQNPIMHFEYNQISYVNWQSLHKDMVGPFRQWPRPLQNYVLDFITRICLHHNPIMDTLD